MATIVYGRNAVRASIDACNVKTLYVARHLDGDKLVDYARKKKLDVKFVENNDLTRMAKNSSHQGFVAIGEDYALSSIEEIIESAKVKQYPLIVILDGIEDPHNLGAILRTADAFGVDGIIMKNRGQVQLNGTVAKVSTGAINYVKVAAVNNLSNAIEKLKQSGYWIVASDGSANQSYLDIDYKCPIALVVGSEGFGIAPLVLKRSDFVVKIPMHGHVSCLNASVATAVILAGIISSR
ncbi:MAG: 23S rRNA (guanosine(2251)-2'-O)-methyltransferase RlmB [Bacilli bacterium]|nr:23S rRNA (guanosine(2251)-2'-O)-methyltransferase RlmB [Bacilli bacterium]